MVFQEQFLLMRGQYGQIPELLEMGPAVLIAPLQFVITALREQRANCYMHEVLFLFFAEFFLHGAQFLDPDQEKNGFHVRLLAKTLHQLRFQVPPPDL